MKDKHTGLDWLPKLSLPRLGDSPNLKEKETIEQLEAEIHQLRKALRWSLGFIVNCALGMEITDGPKVETAQIRQGIKEGLKKSHVPRGILTNLDDVPAQIKDWDFRTFRVEQDIEVLEKTDDRIVLKHDKCPEMFTTMRRSARFLIERVDTGHYLYLPTPLDFLCVPHTLCRSVLVSWLSDDKFQVEELHCRQEGDGVCAFAVKRVPVATRRSGQDGRSARSGG